jgi:hypothetical protein
MRHVLSLSFVASFMAINVTLADTSDRVVLGQKKDNEDAMTVNDGIPVKNPPTEVTDSPPTADSYNKIYNTLFDGDFVDISRNDGLLKLAEHIKNETSNGLFAKLKKREKEFHGKVVVEPTVWKEMHEQIIIVRARILYIERGKRGLFGGYDREPKNILRSENILIYFNDKGIYEKTFKGVPTRQEVK